MAANEVANCDPSTGQTVDELDRIRTAYARRTGASRYSMFEPAQMLAIQERERQLLELLRSSGLASTLPAARILEIGCGTGIWLREFVRWGAQPENITGIDLLPDRIREARRLCPSAMTLLCQSAAELQNAPTKYDLVLQSTVFTSILDREIKRQIARVMLDASAEQGTIIWYDFRMNNPRNPDVRGIENHEIRALFPGCSIHLQRLTLAPPLGRPLARLSLAGYRAASCIKPLCTHYLGLITKNT